MDRERTVTITHKLVVALTPMQDEEQPHGDTRCMWRQDQLCLTGVAAESSDVRQEPRCESAEEPPKPTVAMLSGSRTAEFEWIG